MALHVLDEANRCLGCKKPLCQQGCPIHTNIPEVIRLLKANQMDEAGRMLFENNPLTTVCALVCNHENQCEGHCVRNRMPSHDPVHFSIIEDYISTTYANKMTAGPAPKNGMKAAVVGSGPAGLTIAVLVHLAIVQMFNDQVVQGQASHFQAALEQQRAEALMESYTAQRRLKQAEQPVAAAEAAVDALTAQQTAAQKELPARSAEELTAQQTALTAAREALRSREKQLSAQLLPNRKTAAQYRAAAEARQTLESRWQWVSALAATAGGTLTSKQKIKLEAYIQMNYLDRILRYANTRLMQMTAGQYELERIGAENQRSQSGLDLGVIDHYNGTRRSVKTLSGGESFKASLALALGLSDEVQSSAGGIRLDTLFLDEGFGSLDEESLELAIRVLSGLTEGDRLVGIISHVGALKDRIDQQVVVHKNRTGGSTVELRV